MNIKGQSFLKLLDFTPEQIAAEVYSCLARTIEKLLTNELLPEDDGRKKNVVERVRAFFVKKEEPHHEEK